MAGGHGAAHDREALDVSGDLGVTEEASEHPLWDYWQQLVDGIGREGAAETSERDYVLAAVGDLEIGRFTGRRRRRRAPDLAPSGASEDFIVVLGSESAFQLEQWERRLSGDGGVVLADLMQSSRSIRLADIDVIGVFLPREREAGASASARPAAGLSIDANQPSFAMVAAYLRALTRHGPSLEAASAMRMAAVAVDLIASCVAEKIGHVAAPQTSGAGTVRRAQAYLATNLGVPRVGMREVAATLNISIRRLHQVSADEGISLMGWMWGRRLLRAHALLSDPMNQNRSVAAIAFECGFADQAHFSRRFKLRFGRAPSELRAGLPAAATASP